MYIETACSPCLPSASTPVPCARGVMSRITQGKLTEIPFLLAPMLCRATLQMKKYRAHDFGKCTVHGCKSYLLPLGMSDRVGVDHVKVYCPSCRLAFSLPKDHECSGLDGAYFGRTFPHLLVMQYPDVFNHSPQPSAYVPRVFGFRVHDGNRQKSQEELVRENTSLRRQLRDLEAKLGVMKVEPHHRSSKRRSSSSKSSRSTRELQRDHKHTSSAVDAHKRQKTAGRTG